MIRIEKGKEPDSWLQHRKTSGAQYEATKDLRDALLKDQGYICAYCMRRIPAKDNGTPETTRIEHVISQSTLSLEDAMDYGNMVICCPGAISSVVERHSHCDRHKSEAHVSFSPFDENFIATLDYKRDGTIYSTDAIYDTEINKILNLNIELLKANRKEIRKKLIQFLGVKKTDWKRADLKKILNQYKERDNTGQLKEYCGVVIKYLSKRL